MDIPLFCDVIGCRRIAHVALLPEADFQLTEYLCLDHWEALRLARPESVHRYGPLGLRSDLAELARLAPFTDPPA